MTYINGEEYDVTLPFTIKGQNNLRECSSAERGFINELGLMSGADLWKEPVRITVLKLDGTSHKGYLLDIMWTSGGGLRIATDETFLLKPIKSGFFGDIRGINETTILKKEIDVLIFEELVDKNTLNKYSLRTI